MVVVEGGMSVDLHQQVCNVGLWPNSARSPFLVSGDPSRAVFGHPSGTLAVGVEAVLCEGEWLVSKALMSRSARRLM